MPQSEAPVAAVGAPEVAASADARAATSIDPGALVACVEGEDKTTEEEEEAEEER